MNLDCTTDALLDAFWEARTDAEANRILERLLRDVVSPLIRKILRREFAKLSWHAGSDWEWDFEDVCSTARTNLITRLVRLRNGSNGRAVNDLAAYTAKIAYSAWSDYTHTRCPGLTKVRYRLQYLLENRTNQKGFQLWEAQNGETLCGFTDWNGDESSRGKRHLLLSEQPLRAAVEAFPDCEPKRLNLAELTAGLLRWLKGPVELHTLAAAVAAILEVVAEPPSSLSSGEAPLAGQGLIDPRPCPFDEAKWREYLGWLAAEVARLPMRQRIAFLLNSSVTKDFEFHGILSVRELAALLEHPVKDVARWWNRLPLDDRTTAGLLGLQRQQVINLRRAARDTLGRRWKNWTGWS